MGPVAIVPYRPSEAVVFLCCCPNIALAIAAFMHLIVSVAIIKAIALFLGLEGTFLLASSLSPSHDELKVARQSGESGKRKFQTAVSYNRWLFHGGLGLLALSFVLSAIPG